VLAWLSSRQEFEVKASRAARKEARKPSVMPTTSNTIAAAAAASKLSKEAGPVSIGSVASPSISLQAQNPASDRRFASAPQVNSRLTSEQPPLSRRSIVKAEVEQLTVQSIEQKLDSLQQMIADLSRRSSPRGLVDIPPELFPHYLTLVEADVEDELAHDLIQSLHRHAAAGQLTDTASTLALLTGLIEQRIPCCDSLESVRGRRQIAVLVGPTGVGKTTTLAKLAGHFGVQQGCRVGLITVDTYRVAATEQLRTYAEIIDLPMRIVTNVEQMQEALDSFATCDLVLIDTAGCSPVDDERFAEFKHLVNSACPDHVYLVLSLASGSAALRNTADRFTALKPTSIVFTKLDEAVGCGGLLSAAHNIGLPVSYITTGQEVPLDIEPANPCRAARLIVGTELLGNRAATKVD
jgi:flagellar biosynthesis protein FlhF